MIRRRRVLVVCTASLALASCLGFLQPAVADEAADEAKRFAALEQQLSGTALVGYSTDSNKKPDELRDDSYQLVMVKHLQGDSWMVQAKFHYRDQDFVLPLTLPIRWAGDTPVISLDEFPVPGLGKFDARVMIYQDHYAGFWSGAGHSGHIFGKVERTDEKPSE